MANLKDKVVLITGASSGIGQACAREFAKQGAKLILLARRQDRLEALQSELGAEAYMMTVDIANLDAIKAAFAELPVKWQSIDFLVNNAGVSLALDKIQDGNPSDWDQMIDVNIKGLLYITRQVLPGMVARDSGYVFNIGSISAYQVYSGGSVYCATKFAVRALSEGIKMDVHDSAIRVTEIDPGMVNTEYSTVRFSGDDDRAQTVYQGLEPLVADDIADAILYCASTPERINIRSLAIYPTAQTAAHMVKRNDN